MPACNTSYLVHDRSNRRLFAECFNRKPFLFPHSLDSHPLLTFEALGRLADKWAVAAQPRGFLRMSGASLDSQWGTSSFHKTVVEGFEEIDRSKMRLKLSRIHVEPGYGELLDACARELSALTSANLERDYCDALATVFITSPGEFTPCHMDVEANFLLQICGTKTVYILDGNDREIMSWRDLEEYWHGHGRIPLTDELKAKAYRFELRPGLGIHNPVSFPHWVETGPSPSISLSLGFTPNRSLVDVLHVNHHLRKLGLTPTPPGKRAKLDGAKSALVRRARSIKRVLRSS